MGTVVGSWRLSVLIVMVFLAGTLLLFGVIFNSNVIEDSKDSIYFDGEWRTIDGVNGSSVTLNETTIDTSSQGEGQNFLDYLNPAYWFDIFTYGWIEEPSVRVFMNIINIAIMMTVAYLIYSFLIEWKPDWL